MKPKSELSAAQVVNGIITTSSWIPCASWHYYWFFQSSSELIQLGGKLKKTQPDILSALVVNPMLKKLSRKVMETTMKMEIKKKAAMLAQMKKAMLKMKEK